MNPQHRLMTGDHYTGPGNRPTTRPAHRLRPWQTRGVRMLGGLLLALPLLVARPADAIKEVDTRPADLFGMVGIVRGQAARLNVVNTLMPTAPESSRACQVELGFVDGEGRSLGRTTAALMPGQASFFDVFFDVFDDAGAASRLQVRAFIIEGGRA